MRKLYKIGDSQEKQAIPRLLIFIGAYGSGKSEVSVHFARELAKAYKRRKIVLVDLDIVNPFYRSADAKELLAYENVRVIAPVFANTHSDVPAIPPEVSTVFDDPDVIGVFDLGGEDMGAKVLAGMRKKIEKVDGQVFMVINTFRPFTVSAQGIAQTAKALSEASKLRIDGLIDNSNLLQETTGEELMASYPVLQQASEMTGIPICYASGLDEYLPNHWKTKTPNDVPLLRMKRSIFYNY